MPSRWRNTARRSSSVRIGLMVIDALHIDLVVLLVGTDELHPDDAGAVLHFHHQAVLVAAKVEDNAVVAADACTGILVLHILRRCPAGLQRLLVPALERAACIAAPWSLPEPLERALGDD